MPIEVKLSHLAVADLVDIEAYTARTWGDVQVEAYLGQLEERFYWLAEHVHLGQPRGEIAPNLYSFPEGKHIIFYRYNGGMLEVARILHRSMDVEQQFE